MTHYRKKKATRCVVCFTHLDFPCGGEKAQFATFGIKSMASILPPGPQSEVAYIKYEDLPRFLVSEGDADIEGMPEAGPNHEAASESAVAMEAQRGVKQTAKFLRTSAMHGACVRKASANPTVVPGRTNHIEGIVYGCNVSTSIRVFTCGEGAGTNLAQYLDYLLECRHLGKKAPLLSLIHI